MSDVGVELVLDLLPDGLVLADETGAVQHVNAAARALLELEGEPPSQLSEVMALQDLDGNDWFDCVAPYNGMSLRKALVESSWRTASGRELLVTGTLRREGPGGKVSKVALALRDARARARLDRERSDLVATVAHELRSPLTGVKGFTATLLSKWDQLSDSQRLLMLGTVDADADRLTRLIAELLDVARIDSGRLTVRKELVDLTEVVTAQLEPISTSNGRSIRLHSSGRPHVWVDKDKWSQVVANLVENAVRHGGGDVTVELRETPGEGAEFIVDDEGPGIPEEIRPRVFTKFWKHGQAGGSGLGLYIVGGLVKGHDGTVRVEAAPTGGARMRVSLPLGKPPALD
ncbi:MAG: ATP-binding protein [Nocardioidaceae bacterium]